MTTAPTNPCLRLRPNVRALRAYTPGEQITDCLKLNTNESAWPPSPAVAHTLHNYALEALRVYPQPLADDLRQVAASHYDCQASQILAGNGSDDCLTILYRAFCGPGSHIATPWPSYGLYDTLAGIQDIPAEHHAFDHSWELPGSLYGNQAALTLIANPNNPSATCRPRDELRDLAASLPGLLVVDEAYVDFAGADSSILPWLDDIPNLVVLRTFSKSYSLAGARLGLLFGSQELVAQLMKIKDSYNVNALTQAVGIAALQDHTYHRHMVTNTVTARVELEGMLSSFGWTWPRSQANFLLCQVGPRAEALYRSLKQRGILVRWWDTDELREKLRITIGQAADNQRLVAALQDLDA